MQEKEIKILLKLKDSLTRLIQTKADQLHLIEDEMKSLSSQCEMIDRLISKGSFTSAVTMVDAEMAANHKETSFQNLEYTQKIFSPTKELLAVLQFQNNSVLVHFPNPQISKITQELYINRFVKPHLVSLKKIEKNLAPTLIKNIYNSEEFLDSITLSNIVNFESFEYIVESVNEMFKED